MGLIITPQAEINKYFESSALSQSYLKKLLGGMHSFLHNKKDEKELYYTEKGHFIIGSAVDTLLTGEDGEFDKQYYVSQIEKKPSEVEMSIIQKVFDEAVLCNTYLTHNLADHLPQIQESILEHNWQPNWKIDTKINKIIDVGSEYWEDLKAGYGKQLISVDEKNKIDAIVESLVNNARTTIYFDRKYLKSTNTVDMYYQLPIYFKYKEIDCKALLDMLLVYKDSSGNIVAILPVDLKTMSGNTLQFTDNLKRFGYAIQAAWYYEALKTRCLELFIINTEEFSKVCRNFTFIVESSDYPGVPLIYVLNQDVMLIGKYGRRPHYLNDNSNVLISKEIIGFDKLIDTYIYQNDNDWREEEIITKNDGRFTVDWNGIIS